MVDDNIILRWWERRLHNRPRKEILMQGFIQSDIAAVNVASGTALVVTEEYGDAPRREYASKVRGVRVIHSLSPVDTRVFRQPPVYTTGHVRPAFRIPKILVTKVTWDLMNHDYKVWRTRVDATGKSLIRSGLNILSFLRILGSGRSFDDVDDSAQMGRQTVRSCFHQFCNEFMPIYGAPYLNVQPSASDLASVESRYE